MFRKLLSRFRRAADSTPKTDAQQAVEHASRSLADAKSRNAEVFRVAGELRRQREINHIRERIALSLRSAP